MTYEQMIKEQAEKYNTTTKVIDRAQMIFCGAEPETVKKIHTLHGYSITLADCVNYVKAL